MFGQVPAIPPIDQLPTRGGVPPELASRSLADAVGRPDTLGASPGILSDTGKTAPLPALVARTPIPHRAVRALPIGIILYLLSLAIVASASVGVFFGIGFFLLAKPTEAMNASAGIGEHGTENKRRLPPVSSNASSTHDDIASVPIEPQIPRSAAAAVLPVAQAAGQPSPIGDEPTAGLKDRSPEKGAPGPDARGASPEASPTVTPTTEPALRSSTGAPASEGFLRLSAGQITELLARGDSFLHAGDVASARLFYERAADAGDWQGAIRMAATFDPSFLGRAGVRTAGDLAKAQSWYRHALDLGAPKTERQVANPKTK